MVFFSLAYHYFPLDTSPFVTHLILLSIFVLMLITCIIMHWTGDDDDEIYFAMFRPEASPVATPHAFAKIMERLPRGTKILDIGVGSATYLEHEKVRSLLKERDLHVVGVDISAPNVDICKERIKKHKLEAHFAAHTIDVCELSAKDGVYDAILFMESFPCMSVGLFNTLLKHAHTKLLAPTGTVYLYHNLMDTKIAGKVEETMGRLVKPRFKYLLGIDFGRLTTLQQMERILKESMPSAEVAFEVLLSANAREVTVDFSGVSDRWHALCGWAMIGISQALGTQMEQHLITLKPAKKTN